MQDLSAYLGLSGQAYVQGVNNLGQLVLGVPGFGPALFDGSALYKISDLRTNLPAGVTIGAADINDAGQIAGAGTWANGTQHASG